MKMCQTVSYYRFAYYSYLPTYIIIKHIVTTKYPSLIFDRIICYENKILIAAKEGIVYIV